MADNYLENRMDEYRSGRLSLRNRTTAAMRAPRRSDTLTLRYPPMVVLIVADGIDDVVSETVKAFAGVGCKVAFTAVDPRQGNALARLSGARYYPATFTFEAMLEDISNRWRTKPEVVVDFRAGSQPAVSARVIPVDSLTLPTEVSPAILARHLLYLSHPDNAFLL